MGSYAGQRLEASGVSGWIRFAFIGLIVSFCFQGAFCDLEPTESQCRPYIEKALKEQNIEAEEKTFEKAAISELNNEQEEFSPTDELTDSTEGSVTKEDGNDDDDNDDDDDEDDAGMERKEENKDDEEGDDAHTKSTDNDADEEEDIKAEEQDDNDEKGDEDDKDDGLENGATETEEDEAEGDDDGNKHDDDEKADEERIEPLQTASDQPVEEVDSGVEAKEDQKETAAADAAADENGDDDDEEDDNLERRIEIEIQDIVMDDDDDDDKEDNRDQTQGDDIKPDEERQQEKDNDSITVDNLNDTNIVEDDQDMTHEDENEEENVRRAEKESADHTEEKDEDEKDQDDTENKESDEEVIEKAEKVEDEDAKEAEAAAENEAEKDNDNVPEEEELINEVVIPENLRPRGHIDKILRLEDSDRETILEKTIDATLKALKNLYDNAIKPLEILYKYRDLSNRHFGDPEIFSKPLILFMGPWSGGKSSTINYLLDNEFSQTSLRTGAEPSPAYFNILMYGEEEEILDGTQLAADWTFSGLQKFGQSLLDRLKGIKMPKKLLEKVNIVEIPGILEIRKQVQRLFPFNDACQWFIDRADIIFLVYDPSKLDVGPETEAILDQLKGREYQTRIILNKADQVKPEELMRVQGTLIWNISPLMSSSEPPIMYSTSLWSLPYEVGAPTRLLQAQERAFLKDLREAIDKRVENKIASARRFAVRVRNHAKMVDCYLTTYYNHKTIFGNRKRISDDIIEYPQKYHIYEGLSTLTNISRYDLPDPDVYRDFFKINPLYEFKKLSETCTYFRGCPINKLDVAIAYDLPELVGKYKKAVEAAKEQLPKEKS